MDESAVAAAILRDYARLPGLAFAVARCGDHRPRDVLQFAWMYCEDPLALSEAAQAACPDSVRVTPWQMTWQMTRPTGWSVALAHRVGHGWISGACYHLEPPRAGAPWWRVSSAWRLSSYDVGTLRRALRRVVSLRAMLGRLGLAGGRRG